MTQASTGTPTLRSGYAAILLVALALLAPLPVIAVDVDQVIQPSAAAREGATTSVAPPEGVAPTGMVFAVYAVLLLGGGVAVWRYLRRAGPRLSSSAAGGIELCRTRSLGNRQYLVVAQVEGKRLLLGVGPGFISNLTELSPETDLRPVPEPKPRLQPDTIHDLPANGGSPSQLPFNQLLTRINERLGKPGEGPRK